MNKIMILMGIAVVVLLAVVIGQNTGIFHSVGNLANTTSNNNPLTNTSSVLNLSNQGLKSIPSYVFNQTNLEELNVSHNALTGAIQSQIGQLKNLKILRASYNQMTGVPAEIGQLQNLQMLDLSYNQITGLPHELANLKNLRVLNLAGNAYSSQDLDYIRAGLPNTYFILK